MNGAWLEWGEPRWLLLLLLLPLLWWVQKRGIVRLSPPRQRLNLILRITLGALLVVALAEPAIRVAVEKTHLIWVLDASRSVDGTALEQGRAQYTELRSNGPRPDRETVLLMGGKLVQADPETPEDWDLADVDPAATKLQAAIGVGAALFEPGHRRTMVVVSDGRPTDADLESISQSAASADIRVHTLPAAPPDRPEVLVQRVAAPTEVRAEEPFSVQATILSTREQEAELSLYRNGVRTGSRTVQLKPGENQFQLNEVAGTERVTEIGIEIEAEQDSIAENNLATALIRSSGQPRVLMISDRPEASRYLAMALRQEGIELESRPPAGTPRDLSDLQNYDLLLFDNIPATDLQPQQMELIASYVRDFGGGFLMLGGDQSFGLGGYYRTAIDEILPVQVRFEKENENPSLGLALVLDRSGSMSGDKIELAKEAGQAAVELLSPNDYVGVVAFDSNAFWIADMTSAADQASVIRKIGTLDASGGTNMAPGMQLAYDKLSTTPAKIKHVVVMTDGISQPGPFYELTSRMASDGITVSAVAVGADSDRALLEQIASWGGGRFYFTDSGTNLPQIFARESVTASKSAIAELPFQPQVVKPAPFLADLDFTTAPFLLGSVVTRLRPTADLWLTNEKGEPLLATWRYGLGQAGAFTSDARNRWAIEWLRWPGYAKFWAQVVRKLMREPSLGLTELRVDREGDAITLTVDAAAEDGGHLAGGEVEATLLDPAGDSRTIMLEEVEPGRYQAATTIDDRGGYHFQIVTKQGERTLDQRYGNHVEGYPPEYSLAEPDPEGLAALAEATGGTFDPDDLGALLETDDRVASQWWELWPWCLALAALLLIADIAVRRLPE